MTWSQAFSRYLRARKISQFDAVQELRAAGSRVTQSQVSYWCRGSRPRLAVRKAIETWSQGLVSAELHAVEEAVRP